MPTEAPPQSAPATKRGIKRGEWNHVEGFLGIRGCGKSALMTRRALELAAQTPCFIIAHDAQRQLKDELPASLGGWKTRIVRFETVANADAWLTREGDNALGRIVAVSCMDGTEVVAFAHNVAARSLARSPRSEGPAPPVVCMLDEITRCKGLQSSYLDQTMHDAIALARHKHCALLWGVQSVRRVHHEAMGQATVLYVFKLKADAGLQRLAEEADLTEESLQLVKRLNQYEYIRAEPGGFKAQV